MGDLCHNASRLDRVMFERSLVKHDSGVHLLAPPHRLADARHVIDVRNIGLVAGIELAPRADAPGQRATELFRRCFDEGLLIRVTGDTIALSPPLIIEEAQIEAIVAQIGRTLREID